MSSGASKLDRVLLLQLRQLMTEIRTGNQRLLPAAALSQLARQAGGALTIDFDAAESLGQPLVVLRTPSAQATDPRFATLSRREQEVAALLAEGLRNKEIASRLFISEATVKDHVHQILRKTGLTSRAAVTAALRR